MFFALLLGYGNSGTDCQERIDLSLKHHGETAMHQRLWYKKPASTWLEALPIGTGRLAGMVMGTVKMERVALNHEFLWRGINRFRETERRSHLLNEVRRLLLEGNYEEGTKTGNDAFGGTGGISGIPNRIDPYQPAGDLYFEINHGFVYDYQRMLDLETGCVWVTYVADRKKFIRQYIAHLSQDVILVRIFAEGEPFSCAVWLDRIYDPQCQLRFISTTEVLLMEGTFKEGIDFCIRSQLWHQDGSDGIIEGKKVAFWDTREVIICIDIGTSAQGNPPMMECDRVYMTGYEWQELFDSHVREYKHHYRRMELVLPFEEPQIPTDERLRNLRTGGSDPALVPLFFNYGRYLLCASGAKGRLPANLQGKWNEDLNPPWQGDYHHNINLQMNYWAAEPLWMQDYTEALFQHIGRLLPHARKAARDLYGCRGVLFPLRTDSWNRATPESYGCAVWIGAAAWLAQHMWWHYEYGQDEMFLCTRAYPFIKEVVEFYEDYLIEDSQGTLQIVPSQSPENRFKESGRRYPVSLCVSATMDVQLAQDVLLHAVKASEILGVDVEKRKVWQRMLEKLPKMKIGSMGQLLEWNQEFEEVDPGHRHLSHLFALFPGDQITLDHTPELFQAAMMSLKKRIAHGCGQCGWSCAWIACCFARSNDGNSALEHLNYLLANFTTDTLLTLYHPRIFQIDGNIGATAAVSEMLLHSYHEDLDFLPALPSSWSQGNVRGLRARGGYFVNMEWADCKVTKVEIKSVRDRKCSVKVQCYLFKVMDSLGRDVPTRVEGNRMIFDVKGNMTYFLLPV